MPQYLFHDKNNNKEWIERMGIQEAEDFLTANPHITRLVYGAPAIVDSIRIGRKKPDDGFRDILRNIKKKHRRSTVNTF